MNKTRKLSSILYDSFSFQYVETKGSSTGCRHSNKSLERFSAFSNISKELFSITFFKIPGYLVPSASVNPAKEQKSVSFDKYTVFVFNSMLHAFTNSSTTRCFSLDFGPYKTVVRFCSKLYKSWLMHGIFCANSIHFSNGRSFTISSILSSNSLIPTTESR